MILLYSNNEQVALDANMSRIKGIPQLKSVVDDHVYGGYIFHHSGVVYDFCGNIILKNAYASNPNGYSNAYVFGKELISGVMTHWLPLAKRRMVVAVCLMKRQL